MKNKTGSQNLIEKAFHQSVYAISITDLEGRLLCMNDAFLKLYNFKSEKQLLGKTQKSISSPKTARIVYEEMWDHLKADKIWSGEITNLTSDGREVFIHLTITPIFEGKRKIGYMGFSMDRSQQVVLEKQLLHANKLVVLGTLGAGLAHELNNPLASVSLEAEYIQETLTHIKKLKNLKSLKAAINSILLGVERMNRVIEHLMVYSRKEESADRELLSVNSIIEDSFLFLDKQLKNRGIKVQLKIDQDLNIYGRKMDMESVIHNLLTNSRDAFLNLKKPNKHIRMNVSMTEDNWMLLDYQDNAGGIHPDILDRVFDPFFTTKAEGEGTGLGLAITKKIIVEMGGVITCDSKNGVTQFRIRLPLYKEDGEQMTEFLALPKKSKLKSGTE
jgi:PAS domain S-box-containing protein